jgi:hypothetical protein
MGFCGGSVSSQEKAAQASQSKLADQMTQQAAQIMGFSSKVFQDLIGAFEPILAAGPNQAGYDQPTMARLKSEAITQTGIAARNAMTAVKEGQAAVGGGNVALPGGSAIGQQLYTANVAAQQGAQELSNIEQQSVNLGRQNFMAAAGVLGGAPQVFNPATQAGQTATGAWGQAAQTAQHITSVQNQPGWGMGILGAVGGIMGGLGSMGVGFSGGDASPAWTVAPPDLSSLAPNPFLGSTYGPSTGPGF